MIFHQKVNNLFSIWIQDIQFFFEMSNVINLNFVKFDIVDKLLI